MYVNLLPEEYVGRQIVRRLVRCWIVILLVGLVGGGVALAPEYLQVARLRQQIADDNARHSETSRVLEEIASWEQQLDEAQAQTAAIEKLRSDRRVVSLLGLIVQSTCAAGGKTRLQELNIRVPATHAPASTVANGAAQSNSPPPAAHSSGTLTIDGLADDATTISKFVAALREASFLSQVSLKGSSENAATSEPSRQFRIEGNF